MKVRKERSKHRKATNNMGSEEKKQNLGEIRWQDTSSVSR